MVRTLTEKNILRFGFIQSKKDTLYIFFTERLVIVNNKFIPF